MKWRKGKTLEQTLQFRVSDILHRHYYPTMHEAIADYTLFKCADEIIAECKSQIQQDTAKRIKAEIEDRSSLRDGGIYIVGSDWQQYWEPLIGKDKPRKPLIRFPSPNPY